MAKETTPKTKTVDFIPEYGISGDYKKIVEYGFLEYNSLIMPVIALLFMDEGSNTLVPDMGIRDVLVQFPYSEEAEIEALVSKVNFGLRYAPVPCTASIDTALTDWITGDVTLRIDITGIPAPLKVSVNKDTAAARTFKVIPPNSFK
jgi:hypothetical protein